MDSNVRGEIFEKGIKVVDENGSPIKINRFIADGGQGEVYHVTYRGNDYALKWYCKSSSDVIGGAQYQTISGMYGEKKRPSDRFIWPLYMVTEEKPEKGKKFGYLMPLLPEGYYEMERFLRNDADGRAVRFKSFNAKLTAGMNIARGMKELHVMKGFSYKDLNPRNFAINPETGDVKIVDNDNVSVDGSPCSVKGTKGFMAPEIPRSRYKQNPGIDTDYYSLAVVLYELFCIDHPMEGKTWEKYPLCTDTVEEHLYAIKPVFHFDPENDSNRPTDVYAPNAYERFMSLPRELRMTFITVFTEGIENVNKRPPEIEWISVISRARDTLIKLASGKERFVNFSVPESVPPGCLGLKIGGNKIAMYPHKALYQIAVDGNDREFTKIYGGIVYDKNIKSLAIRNMSPKIWTCYSPVTKQKSDLERGQEFPISPGVQILFQRENPKIVGVVFDPKTMNN
ncbi:MAG: hypothetical protein K5886_04380 [Lachnospiraceae bacterium]|nr:hypothetical protein [Lachnospiraceae bacterium]